MSGTLYLIPCDLGSGTPLAHLPPQTLEVVARLNHFVVEDARSARRFLGATGRTGLREIAMQTLNEHTAAHALPALLAPLHQGFDVGLLSEAGCPAIADPGADLMALAHRECVKVVPLIGPSAILLALMASGLGGQHFSFNGYLPVDTVARQAALRALEARSATDGSTQLFIETPYRSAAMLSALMQTCRSDTLITVATDLTLASEWIQTRSAAEWQAGPAADLAGRPCVFALRAGATSAIPSRLGPAPRHRKDSRRNAGPRVR